MGQAASMASLLLAAGELGQRRSLPNTRIMLHQPSGGASVRACLYTGVSSPFTPPELSCFEARW
jgi:hypothetical protein